MPEQLADALALVRDAARALVSAFPKEAPGPGQTGDAAATQAKGWAQELFKTAERMAAGSDKDVLWINERERNRGGNQLCVAPLEVAGPMREKLLTEKTAIFTSATLKLGGDFDAVADLARARPRRPRRRLAGPRRGVAVRLHPAGDPLRRQAPAAAGTRRADAGPPRRDHRARRRRRRPHPRAVLEPAGRRGGRRARPRGAAAPDHAGPGRRAAARAGPAVRRRPAHQPVRHASACGRASTSRARPASW